MTFDFLCVWHLFSCMLRFCLPSCSFEARKKIFVIFFPKHFWSAGTEREREREREREGGMGDGWSDRQILRRGCCITLYMSDERLTLAIYYLAIFGLSWLARIYLHILSIVSDHLIWDLFSWTCGAARSWNQRFTSDKEKRENVLKNGELVMSWDIEELWWALIYYPIPR